MLCYFRASLLCLVFLQISPSPHPDLCSCRVSLLSPGVCCCSVSPLTQCLPAGDLCSLLLVSVLWGATNPFLRRGAEGLEGVKEERRLQQLLSEARFLISNYRYVIPFLLNQSGSVVFYMTLASAELSLAVPLCNSLALVFTLVTGRILGEDIGGREAVFGLFLTSLGITLCVASSVNA
ncbi:transmembrane protein 234 isoform X1 [Ascaphus truei]|uniref:transmembrane protein 234 isoform X1 n=1 Tax=Ascaphus truei TaxID=8439 RepID=UPI003F5A6A9B